MSDFLIGFLAILCAVFVYCVLGLFIPDLRLKKIIGKKINTIVKFNNSQSMEQTQKGFTPVGNFILLCTQTLGLSIDDLCFVLGCKETELGIYLLGVKPFSKKMFKAIESAYGISASFLEKAQNQQTKQLINATKEVTKVLKETFQEQKKEKETKHENKREN